MKCLVSCPSLFRQPFVTRGKILLELYMEKFRRARNYKFYSSLTRTKHDLPLLPGFRYTKESGGVIFMHSH